MKNNLSGGRRTACAVFLGLLCAATAAGAAVPKTDPALKKALADFSAFYAQALKETGIAGSSFMLDHGSRILLEEYHGLANIEKNQPVDRDTIYHWASITKTFTGIAIMQLRDRGLLKLEDPVIKYIPELREVHDPFGVMSEITIAQLLSHTAGFRGATWPWKDKPWQPHEPLHWEQLEAMFPYTEIEFKPGSKWSYSNPGIVFLGRIIELLTTDDYEVYVDKNILRPLEMYRSYFDATPYHLLKHRSPSYWQDEAGKLTPAIFDVNTGITVSNGGLNAPFTDFVKYVDFLIGNPDKQAVYDGVLKRSTLEEMFEPRIDIPAEDFEKAYPGDNRKDHMGFTYFVEDNFGKRFIGHSGGQNAFVTHFYYLPEAGAAYIVGYNTTGPKTKALDVRIKEHLFRNIFPLLRKAN
jgi:CubicO group peptidase (beta-lactamase class C family)